MIDENFFYRVRYLYKILFNVIFFIVFEVNEDSVYEDGLDIFILKFSKLEKFIFKGVKEIFIRGRGRGRGRGSVGRLRKFRNDFESEFLFVGVRFIGLLN